MRSLHKRISRGGVALTGSLLAVLALSILPAAAAAKGRAPHKKKAPAAQKGAITLGGLFTNAPFAFGTDALNMTKAVFADVNAHGGIHGRKIVFTGGNDSENTTTTRQLAQEYIGGGAVAMVGSASFVDCTINGAYYTQHHVVSITAVGVPEQCYTNPNIASVEPSPYTQLTASLYYAYKYLHKRKQCLFQPLTPGAGPYINAAVSAYEKATGNKLVIADTSIPASPSGSVSAANIDPLLIRAKVAGCQTFFYGGANEPTAALILGEMAKQGMQKVDFLTVSISYVQQLVGAAAKFGVPVYAITSLYPFTKPGPQTNAYRKLAKKYNVNITEFSADAYMSAQWLVSALKAIKGPITARSVEAYFKAGHRWSNPMAPVPLVFGKGSQHQAVISKLTVVKMTKGGWQLAKFGMTVPR